MIPGAVGFIVVTLALVIGIREIGVDHVREIIEEAGPFAPLVYIGIKVITYTIAPLTSGPIQLFAGALFGLVPGALYTLIGELIGGSINFWLARRFGHPVVARLVGANDMPRIDRFVAQIVDWRTVLYARVFLFSLYDFISYAIGFSPLPFRRYVVLSVVGGILPTFLASLLGTMLTTEQSSVMLVYALLAVASIAPLLFQKRIRRWLKLEHVISES